MGDRMLSIDEINAVCASEFRAKIEADTEAMYQEMLNAQMAEADAMEYASHSYDNDAEFYGMSI
jgi:hypothetical protein